jgi:hypothetical protein
MSTAPAGKSGYALRQKPRLTVRWPLAGLCGPIDVNVNVN